MGPVGPAAAVLSGGQDCAGDSELFTITAPAPPVPAPGRRVLLATCGFCWAGSGAHCKGGPGSHLARWIRAERKGLINRAELAMALGRLGDVDITAGVKAGTE